MHYSEIQRHLTQAGIDISKLPNNQLELCEAIFCRMAGEHAKLHEIKNNWAMRDRSDFGLKIHAFNEVLSKSPRIDRFTQDVKEQNEHDQETNKAQQALNLIEMIADSPELIDLRQIWLLAEHAKEAKLSSQVKTILWNTNKAAFKAFEDYEKDEVMA